MKSFEMHVKNVGQWDRQQIEHLIERSYKMRELDEDRDKMAAYQPLTGRVMSALFYENSSRTFCSFVAAMQKLGGSVVNLPIERSSVSKGESLEDTIRTVDAYSHAIVLRHPSQDALEAACSVAERASVFNAGNGTGEHPTQALLDMFTIHSELGGKIDNRVITLVGDLKHGRTVHSLAKALTKFDGMEFQLVAPEALQMPDEIVEFLKSKTEGKVSLHTALNEEVVQKSNVIYVTRCQKERFASEEAYEAVKNSYKVSKETLAVAKPAGEMVVMHPLPRNEELATDVDGDPRAAYFRQMRCGLHSRMALLDVMLAGK